MAIITKTATVNIANVSLPATFTWVAVNLNNITFLQPITGNVNTNGNLSMLFQYDDTVYNDGSIQCVVDELNCTKDEVGILPFQNLIATNGTCQLFSDGSIATISIVELGLSCTATSGTSCYLNNIPFGTYNVNISANCNNNGLVGFININGQNAQNFGNFIITTDINSPDITATVTCG